MKPTEVLDRIVERLSAQGVELQETFHGVRGRGTDAWLAWEAFCEVARLAADEAFDYCGSPARVDPDSCDNDPLLHESGSTDAGPARPDVDDESRAEYAVRAGHVDTWKRAVEASNSFTAMQAPGPDRFSLARG